MYWKYFLASIRAFFFIKCIKKQFNLKTFEKNWQQNLNCYIWYIFQLKRQMNKLSSYTTPLCVCVCVWVCKLVCLILGVFVCVNGCLICGCVVADSARRLGMWVPKIMALIWCLSVQLALPYLIWNGLEVSVNADYSPARAWMSAPLNAPLAPASDRSKGEPTTTTPCTHHLLVQTK